MLARRTVKIDDEMGTVSHFWIFLYNGNGSFLEAQSCHLSLLKPLYTGLFLVCALPYSGFPLSFPFHLVLSIVRVDGQQCRFCPRNTCPN